MSENEKEEKILGFLSLFDTVNKDGKLGAILLTNFQGVPLEFRCTYPVKPTTIQKPLYGNTLIPYIGTQLCGIPLLKSIHIKPLFIIVDKEYLLDIREESPYPVVFLRRAGESIEIESTDSSKRIRVDSPTGRFQPIVISAHSNFDEDKEIARKIIEEKTNHLDPCEPFERMKTAIDILGKQDDKFQ